MDKKFMLEQLVNYYTGGNKTRFASMLGVKPQTINTWLGRNTFDAELIYSKCEGVSGDWLLSNDGNMLKTDIRIDDVNKELLELCQTLAENFKQRDEVVGRLISIVKILS